MGSLLLIIGVVIGWSLFFRPLSTTDPAALAEGLAYLEQLENQNAGEVNQLILGTPSGEDHTKSSSQPEETPWEDLSSEDIPMSDSPEESSEPSSPESPSLELIPADDPQLLSWKSQIDSASITTLTEEERGAYRSRLSSCALIGDSMAQAALEYGFLDSAHVFYRRGYAIGQLGDAIREAAAMLPSTVIFFTGLNDTDYYAEPALYAEAYLEKIQEVKFLLPDARIFVCSMLPPSDALGATRPDLARAPLYDEALRNMCSEKGISYIDTSWMVNQALYMGDGIHFVSSFYDVWIQYVTRCMGL